MKVHSNVARATTVVASVTFLSRISGLARDIMVATFFGTGMAADAFFVAFRIPNLLRRLVAEGSLTVSFVPVFTEYLNQKSKKEAFELASTAISVFALILALISFLGVLLSPLIITIFAPGFAAIPQKIELTIMLNRIIFPYIFFIGLVALSMGILNGLGHFFAPAAAPILLNLSMITVTIVCYNLFAQPIFVLAVGVIVGGILQLIFQIPYLKAHGFSFKFKAHFRHPAIKRIGLLMLPAAFGMALYQVNIFVATFLASFLPSGSVSYLYYANRIIEFPLGIFAVSMGIALLPEASRIAAENDTQKLLGTFSTSLRMLLFIMFPAMVGLITLRIPIISLIYQHGNFGYDETIYTSQALVCYALGLCAIAGVRITVPFFYGLQDTKTPVKIAAIAIGVDIVASIILMFPLKHNGLALATTVASFTNFILLFVLLRSRIGSQQAIIMFPSIGKICFASALMAGGVHFIAHTINWQSSGDIVAKIVILALSIISGIIIYVTTTYLIKVKEAGYILETIKTTLKRKTS